MTIEELVDRFDDLVSAVQRSADALEAQSEIMRKNGERQEALAKVAVAVLRLQVPAVELPENFPPELL